MERPFLQWVGVVGFIAFPLFYLLRLASSPLAALYDDLALRLVASALCLVLGLRAWWPARFKPYYFAYSYFTVFYCLSFLLSYTMLQNQGGTASVVNMVMGAILITLLSDWRNTMVMLLAGYALSMGVYFLVSANPSVPPEFVISAAGSVLVVLTGALSHHAEKQAEFKRMRRGYAGLAGSIAHEMRNPLGQIKFSLDNIEHTLPRPTTHAEQQALGARDLDSLYQQLAQGQTAIKRGLQIIQMTLDEVSGKPIDPARFEYLEVAKVTQKAVDEYSFDTQGERAKVSLQVTRDFTFKANETVYIFILFNLIKNALYYFKLHPHASLTITVDMPTVRVRDTGPGITPEALEKLFGAFATSGKAEGTGLGLAYCQRAMRAFGGEIGCTSVLGEFTEFTLRFPVVSQDEMQAHEGAVLQGAMAAFQGKRILVVDDQAMMRKSSRGMLAGLGAQLDEAANGTEAIAMMAHTRYDLILMDLNMPPLDGYATAEQIRHGAAAGQSDVPIVAYTSEPAYMAHVKTQKVGMNGYVSKPCSRAELVSALQAAMRSAAGQARAKDSAAHVLAGKTILVADDGAFNRKIVKTYLSLWQAHCVEAEHGQAVVTLLQAGTPVDAILMDMEMPGMGGLQASRIIRADAALASIPIIALTANFSEQHVQEAFAAGMNDFLSKPIEPDTLRDKLTAALTRQAAVKASAALPAGASAADMGTPLLNVERLEGLRRISDEFLHECLTVYQSQMGQKLEQIESHMATRNFKAFHAALHELLGNAGDGGFHALHQFLRLQIYPQVANDHQWPTQEQWLQTAKDLYARSVAEVDATYLAQV